MVTPVPRIPDLHRHFQLLYWDLRLPLPPHSLRARISIASESSPLLQLSTVGKPSPSLVLSLTHLVSFCLFLLLAPTLYHGVSLSHLFLVVLCR